MGGQYEDDKECLRYFEPRYRSLLARLQISIKVASKTTATSADKPTYEPTTLPFLFTYPPSV